MTFPDQCGKRHWYDLAAHWTESKLGERVEPKVLACPKPSKRLKRITEPKPDEMVWQMLMTWTDGIPKADECDPYDEATIQNWWQKMATDSANYLLPKIGPDPKPDDTSGHDGLHDPDEHLWKPLD